LDAGQLADAVERSYGLDELPDWELVFELARRAMSAEHGDVGQQPVASSSEA
jgi:hypothetical protein